MAIVTTSLTVAGLAGSQLQCHSLRTKHYPLTLSWEKQLKRAHKCGGVCVGQVKIVMHVVDHHHHHQMDGDVSHGVHKDLSSLPSG